MTDRLQELFDTTLFHLRKQGCAAMMENPNQDGGNPSNPPDICAYRGKNGSKCAAGIHISDDMYMPSMEGKPIKYINAKYHLGFTANETALLVEMQGAHDCELEIKLVFEWEERMAQIANNFNLNYTSRHENTLTKAQKAR